MVKIITWTDPEGRYRVTSPAYNDRTRPAGETDDQFIQRVIGKLKVRYGLPNTHVFHIVEDATQRTRLQQAEGTYFRYGGIDRDGRSGAWEMDTDGRPKVNMAKARNVQMDYIRKVRDLELEKLDVPFMRAVESRDAAEQQRISVQKQVLRDLPATFSLSSFTTPKTLKVAWPTELPPQ